MINYLNLYGKVGWDYRFFKWKRITEAIILLHVFWFFCWSHHFLNLWKEKNATISRETSQIALTNLQACQDSYPVSIREHRSIELLKCGILFNWPMTIIHIFGIFEAEQFVKYRINFPKSYLRPHVLSVRTLKRSRLNFVPTKQKPTRVRESELRHLFYLECNSQEWAIYYLFIFLRWLSKSSIFKSIARNVFKKFNSIYRLIFNSQFCFSRILFWFFFYKKPKFWWIYLGYVAFY